ncbi:hypothetical protein ES703_118569 [subsurface metagenome]
MNVIQLVNQFGNALQVIQISRSLLPRVWVIDIEGGTTGSGAYPLPAEEDVVLLILSAEPDIGRCHLYKLHSPFLRQAHLTPFPIHPGTSQLKEFQRCFRIYLKTYLLDYPHCGLVHSTYRLFGEGLKSAPSQSLSNHIPLLP